MMLNCGRTQGLAAVNGVADLQRHILSSRCARRRFELAERTVGARTGYKWLARSGGGRVHAMQEAQRNKGLAAVHVMEAADLHRSMWNLFAKAVSSRNSEYVIGEDPKWKAAWYTRFGSRAGEHFSQQRAEDFEFVTTTTGSA